MDDVRERLYGAYSSTHAGVAIAATERLMFLRDISPHLPERRDIAVVDVGCGQGQLVKQLLEHGYSAATGIDVSPEQVEEAHALGIYAVQLGDYSEGLGSNVFDIVTATDFFEHFTKAEVLKALDSVREALLPGGRLIARMPNAVSPFSGNYQHGDLTHETAFTAGSFRQAARATGFSTYQAFDCPPYVHGARSLVRNICWRFASAAMKATIAVETGPRRGHIVTQNFVAVLGK